jgi:diadenosine tetraphosphate (Ap4A) HIT family hydrolase
MEEILKKFDLDNLLLHEYKNWYLLLRKEQVTLGSLVLIEKKFNTKFSQISIESFSELGEITNDIESILKEVFAYDKINYLMLMMVDKEVHFHIIPRYSKNTIWDKSIFIDYDWPKPPDLLKFNIITEKKLMKLKEFLKGKFERKNSSFNSQSNFNESY